MTFERPARLVLALTLVFVTYMALNPMPPETPLDRYGDKVAHMSAFATLAVISGLSFPKASSWRIWERLAFYGALIEVFQATPALHRQCDWQDWVADSFAVAVALVVMAAVKRFAPAFGDHAS